MSLAYNPYGLIPVAHESGIVRPAFGSGGAQPYGGYPIASGYANNIFQNAPIQVDAATPSSNIILAAAQGAAAASVPTASKILGTFQGVEYTLLATGRRAVGNFWAAGTTTVAGSQTAAWITRDANISYQIQANGSVPATAMGALCSITTNASANGNTTTGFSTVGLDTAQGFTQSGTNLNQLRITGFAQQIDNLPGDAFTQVIVKIAGHQDLPQPGPGY